MLADSNNQGMAIADHLIPKLRERFANRGLQIRENARPFAVFPAIHPDVGDIMIYEDDDELTLFMGKFTHGHFSNHEHQLSESQKAEAITRDILRFLDDLFADQVVFWGSHQTGGGWFPRTMSPRHRNEYVWSGPLTARP